MSTGDGEQQVTIKFGTVKTVLNIKIKAYLEVHFLLLNPRMYLF